MTRILTRSLLLPTQANKADAPIMSKLSTLLRRWFWKRRYRRINPSATMHELGIGDEWIFGGIASDSVAIDCGANVGDVTARLVKQGAVVHAFEPNPHAFAILKRRFHKHRRVHLYNKAVSDCNGTMPLFLMRNSPKDPISYSVGSSLVANKINVDPKNSVNVEVVDLCEFISGLETDVALLKLDVEGVECAIMNKLLSTGMHKRIGRILVETHEHKIPALKDDVTKLRQRIDELGDTRIHLNWN